MQYRLLPLELASLYPQHHYIWCSTGYFPYSSITVATTSLHLMQYRLLPLQLHHCTHITTSDAVPVTSLTVGITVPTTSLHLMQYRLVPLQLASLYPHQYIRCSTGYFPYSWHHCTHNITTSDAVPVTSLTVSTTVPTTTPSLMQYRYLPADIFNFN